MQLIDTTEKLEEFCKILEKQPFITVDSEFIREHSYYPKLCLLQVACEEDSAIIDPLSKTDLSAFFDILQNPHITKVFHSGKQDIEIFYNMTGQIPQNVFDTQIAAMVCGYAENIGYGNLVQSITHVELDKSQRLTDWSLRPLDESQLQYAICDVTYLVDCYKYLKDYMQKNHRETWADEETDVLCDIHCYEIKPENAWLKIKHNAHSPQYLSALKYLAEWREKRAQKFNTPRSGILRDDVLLNLASTFPQSVDELRQVRNLKPDIIKGKLGAEIIEVLKEAKEHPMPAEVCRTDRKQTVHIPNNEQSLAEMLKLLLRLKSQECGVIARLIATDEDLRCIIVNQPEKTPAMQGWRYEIFGKYAEQLCRGKLSISYSPKKKKIEFK
ncbi:MAG: ribonuclease D [Alphaproteobacteria bacterium]|nr:ribonuclease D [Alphaproteobacteria bacterium]MBR1757042.1 ribonuclease D [Alphaproteobacteria bacterium]